jgi:mannose-6-phosphate isomerase
MNRGIDFALSMFSYDPSPVQTIREKYFCEPSVVKKQDQSIEYALIDEKRTPCFRVNRIDVQGSYVKKSASFYIGIITRGSGRIRIDRQTYPVKEGEKFFVPFQTGSVIFESEKGMEIIATFPPE